jgi:hypothetical protein
MEEEAETDKDPLYQFQFPGWREGDINDYMIKEVPGLYFFFILIYRGKQ